jgi:hypothetical protein
MSLLLTGEFVEAICARVDGSPLPDEDRMLIKACLHDYLRLGRAFIEKSNTINKLLRMIFGAKTEKASRIIPGLRKPNSDKPHPKGHGRNGLAQHLTSARSSAATSAARCSPRAPPGRRNTTLPQAP